MEFRLLKYFLMIAQEQNISKAAKLLNITQPTLSRQLKDLETELGTSLFIRKDRKMFLTESGQYLKKRAEEILYLTEKTQLEFKNREEILLTGNISIGCIEADNSDTLSLMLEEFLEEHNKVTFSIFTGTSDDIIEKLERGLLDLAILLEPINLVNYNTLVLPRKERWGILVCSDSFLYQKNSIHCSELIGIPLLISGREDIKKMINSWDGVELSKLNVVGTFNLVFNVFSLVENHVASALTIEGAVSGRKNSNTKFLPLEPKVETNSVLVWRKNSINSVTVEKFIEFFNNAF